MWSEANGLMALLGLGFLVAVIGARVLRRGSCTHGGILFFGLGVAIGPMGLAALDATHTPALEPLMAVIVGWVGMQAGLAVTVRKDGGLVDGALRTGMVYSLVAIGALGAACWLAVDVLFVDSLAGERTAMAAAGITGGLLTASPRVLRRVSERVHAAGTVTLSGQSLARIVQVAAVGTLAVAMAFHDRLPPAGLRELAPTEWLIGEVLLGLATGLIADAFIGTDSSPSRLIAVLGAVSLFTTGIAWQLGLTPLTLNLVVGLTLANFGQRKASEHEPILELDTPLLYILLVLIGALWTPPANGMLALLTVSLLTVRFGVLSLAGRVAGRALDPTSAGLRRLGLVTLGQSAPALAIGWTYTSISEPGAGQGVLTIIVASVLLNDLWAAPAARAVLDEAGEIPTLASEV